MANQKAKGIEKTKHYDVLIVGAGISGIDAAYHLKNECPEKTFAIVENQESFGGTWRTHTYPGIRSDSDLFTFGYKWKPWSGTPIATAPEILKYLGEAIEEHGLEEHIQYSHQVKSAHWSSKDNLWTLVLLDKNADSLTEITCEFLWMCQGYYRHSKGYTPDFPGMENFKGDIIHPQNWPKNLDYSGKKVVVIGSGATAATLIPAMADTCEHITMLQRSPTYFFPAPNRNDLADTLRELDVKPEWIHEITRLKVLQDQKVVARRSFEEPEKLKQELIAGARHYLGPDFDVETHFTPSYRPWRQRLAFVPNGDLFSAINDGKASVVTDHIEQITENGISLKSGASLDADIIITATGFNLSVLGDIEFVIDGQELDFADTWAHRGIMFSGIPNMAWVFGYLRTSWTMRANLVSEFVCKLLKHMDEKGVKRVTPQLREEDKDMPKLPFVDEENFNAGYLMRNMHLMPKQGNRQPWIFSQDYYREKDEIPEADLEDGTLIYK
ncbi:flavin-containing monooxygenase [Sneathiella aquimaris]|uniref:flavin-containing monooxygenase n=1 Tax=Sneathiella aquimaris TaxID=2599305 RepID=UPI00146AE5E3|nr:NAD(P)/FAD-dependent oxidoreductase [Sneathiella aquimaris]